MDISPEQKAYIDFLVEGPEGDDLTEWEALCNTGFALPIQNLQSPFELHYLANWWNWDDSTTKRVISGILAHPLCDRGTALLLYWRSAAPVIESDLSLVPDYQKPTFETAALIEARLRAGKFASEVIAYDPKEDDFPPDRFRREVIPEWLEPSKGKAPEFDR